MLSTSETGESYQPVSLHGNAQNDDDSCGGSIVEHPLGPDSGESPQWRQGSRWSFSTTKEVATFYEQGVQTDSLDALFEQKCKALCELEEDIEDAKQHLAHLSASSVSSSGCTFMNFPSTDISGGVDPTAGCRAAVSPSETLPSSHQPKQHLEVIDGGAMPQDSHPTTTTTDTSSILAATVEELSVQRRQMERLALDVTELKQMMTVVLELLGGRV